MLVHNVYMAKKVKPRLKRPLGKTFLREWRDYRNMSLEFAAEYVGLTHASLSRIERGKQPYSQGILEGLAELYMTDKASLLMRNPQNDEGMWSIWDQAKPAERRMLVDLARTVLKRGT